MLGYAIWTAVVLAAILGCLGLVMWAVWSVVEATEEDGGWPRAAVCCGVAFVTISVVIGVFVSQTVAADERFVRDCEDHGGHIVAGDTVYCEGRTR